MRHLILQAFEDLRDKPRMSQLFSCHHSEKSRSLDKEEIEKVKKIFKVTLLWSSEGLWQDRDRCPCASSGLGPGTRKPDTTSSRCAPHLVVWKQNHISMFVSRDMYICIYKFYIYMYVYVCMSTNTKVTSKRVSLQHFQKSGRSHCTNQVSYALKISNDILH